MLLSLSLRFLNLSCFCSSVSATLQALSHSLLLLSAWVERLAPSLSLRFTCLSLAVSAASLLHCSLSSLSSDDFRALLEVVGVSMFTTSNQMTLNSKQKDSGLHVLLDHTPFARTWRTCTHALDIQCTIHTYIYIYQRNSAIELTSVGLAHARPNYSLLLAKSLLL